VVVDLGGGLTFKLAGRIDRIDQIGTNAFEIVDYKTGRFYEADWDGVFAGGTRLQHALYALAAAELLRKRYRQPKVERGVYYFSASRGRQERVSIERPSAANTAAVLTDLRAVIAGGLFTRAADEDSCKWCDFGGACGLGAVAGAEKKLNDPTLKPFVELKSHE
jgi:RecB family exonuclease